MADGKWRMANGKKPVHQRASRSQGLRRVVKRVVGLEILEEIKPEIPCRFCHPLGFSFVRGHMPPAFKGQLIQRSLPTSEPAGAGFGKRANLLQRRYISSQLRSILDAAIIDRTSPEEPRAIAMNESSSLVVERSNPSAMLFDTESAARSSWLRNPADKTTPDISMRSSTTL